MLSLEVAGSRHSDWFVSLSLEFCLFENVLKMETCTVGGGHREDEIVLLTHELDLGNQSLLTASPCPGSLSPGPCPSPQEELSLGAQSLERVRCLGIPWMVYMMELQKTSIGTFNFWRCLGRPTRLVAPKTNFLGKFPCFFKSASYPSGVARLLGLWPLLAF